MSEAVRLSKVDCLVRVLRLRDHLGGQKMLADKLGLNQQYLEDMINCKCDLSDELLEACGIYRVYEAEKGWKP